MPNSGFISGTTSPVKEKESQVYTKRDNLPRRVNFFYQTLNGGSGIKSPTAKSPTTSYTNLWLAKPLSHLERNMLEVNTISPQ
jgi:hypothetical protein